MGISTICGPSHKASNCRLHRFEVQLGTFLALAAGRCSLRRWKAALVRFWVGIKPVTACTDAKTPWHDFCPASRPLRVALHDCNADLSLFWSGYRGPAACAGARPPRQDSGPASNLLTVAQVQGHHGMVVDQLKPPASGAAARPPWHGPGLAPGPCTLGMCTHKPPWHASGPAYSPLGLAQVHSQHGASRPLWLAQVQVHLPKGWCHDVEQSHGVVAVNPVP